MSVRHGGKSNDKIIEEYHLSFLSGNELDYDHAKAELTKEYEELRKEAFKKLEITSALLLGILNNYCIFLYKVLNQKDIAVNILD